MRVCHRADDDETTTEDTRETFAVKVVDLGGIAPGGRKTKKKHGKALGAESGLAEVGDDGEWRLAGLPRRVERVVAEVHALRRLERGLEDSHAEEHDADGRDRSGARALFPTIQDFFTLRAAATWEDSTTSSPNTTEPSGSAAVCHTVMTRCPGGKDLMALLTVAPEHRLPESQARFYVAEIALALDAVHMVCRMVYRDVKPENVLLHADTGHIMLCDFDLATEMKKKEEEEMAVVDIKEEEVCVSFSAGADVGGEGGGGGSDSDGDGDFRPAFVGTEEYIAPEVIKGWPHTAAADWWGLAILLYELTHGRTPFRSRWREQTFHFITTRRVEFPRPEEGGPNPPLSDECKGVIRGMTRRTGLQLCDPAARLAGKEGLRELKMTGFFASFGEDWDETLPTKPPPMEDDWVSFDRHS